MSNAMSVMLGIVITVILPLIVSCATMDIPGITSVESIKTTPEGKKIKCVVKTDLFGTKVEEVCKEIK